MLPKWSAARNLATRMQCPACPLPVAVLSWFQRLHWAWRLWLYTGVLATEPTGSSVIGLHLVNALPWQKLWKQCVLQESLQYWHVFLNEICIPKDTHDNKRLAGPAHKITITNIGWSHFSLNLEHIFMVLFQTTILKVKAFVNNVINMCVFVLIRTINLKHPTTAAATFNNAVGTSSDIRKFLANKQASISTLKVHVSWALMLNILPPHCLLVLCAVSHGTCLPVPTLTEHQSFLSNVAGKTCSRT